MIESITSLDLSILDFIRNTLSSPVADIIMKCLKMCIRDRDYSYIRLMGNNKIYIIKRYAGMFTYI